MDKLTMDTLAELTFVLREAPSRSAYAGQLCAELRATSLKHQILRCLGRMGYWHPEKECAVNVLEKWTHPTKGYKILRFTAPAHVYRELHTLCSPADLVQGGMELARVTDAHLASMSATLAADSMESWTKKQLLVAAQLVDPNYQQKLGAKPTKKVLAEFICAHAA